MARIWDRFLTERDRAQVDTVAWGKVAHQGFGERPALLVVDNTYMFVGDGQTSYLEGASIWPLAAGTEGWEAVERTRDVLAAARAARCPIVYTTGRGDMTASPFFRTIEARTGRPVVPEAYRGRENDIVELIRPEPDDTVIAKPAASAFFCTPLIGHLVREGIDTVVVCGNATSGCVRATVVDASAYGFRVGVIEDCTFDRTEASHAMSLFDMDRKYADVVSSAEVCEYFDRIVSGV